MADDSRLRGLVDMALQIAGTRMETLGRLRAALVNSEDAEALKFARELCGLENDETGHRTDSGLH
jgi:hypothetical protein